MTRSTPLNGIDETEAPSVNLSAIPRPTPPPRLIRFDHIYFAASSLVEVFLEIMSCRLTGKLIINFSQGNPAGEVEWTQRRKEPET